MKLFHRDNTADCRPLQTHLSEYVAGTLSARQTWEVEKHLATCTECATQVHQLQATVQLLQAAPHFDTSDDFMARLHARLDSVEPATASPGLTLRETLSTWLRPRPLLRVGVVATALGAVLLMPRLFSPSPRPTQPSVLAMATEPLRQNVAFVARDPFGDPVAATLEAHSALQESDEE